MTFSNLRYQNNNQKHYEYLGKLSYRNFSGNTSFCSPKQRNNTYSLSVRQTTIPNCLIPDSMHCRIIRRYLGSKICSGQGMPGKAWVQTKMGISALISVDILQNKGSE